MGTDPALIIYDGECVFCNNYVRFVRLRETIGKVDLLDARSDDPRVKRYWREGFDLNEGMLFVYEGKTYHGSEAVYILGGLSSGNSVLNRLNRAIFSSRVASQVLYPFLKIGRRLTLVARGRSMLSRPDAT
jgi:predicted DCC family thiol-disulfide oxidoreductase YuxK